MMTLHHFLLLRRVEGKKAPSPSLCGEPQGLSSPQLMSSQDSSLSLSSQVPSGIVGRPGMLKWLFWRFCAVFLDTIQTSFLLSGLLHSLEQYSVMHLATSCFQRCSSLSLILRCLWNCWTIFKKLIDWMESNTWAMSESARTDGFAFEKTSRHKHAFSWASKLPMHGISSLSVESDLKAG